MIVATPVPARSNRVRKLVRYMETVGGIITLAEAAAVTGARTGYQLDAVLADATVAEPRLYQGESWSLTGGKLGGEYRRRVTVLGLLEEVTG